MKRSAPTWRAPLGPLIPRPDPAVRERWLAALSLALTATSVAVVQSLPFALTLLAILVSHEAGHRLVARAHGLRVSLPLFLPAPFFVGTLGAIIRIHDLPRSRSALLEMGAAGPLAGLAAIAVAMGVALLGEAPAGEEPVARPILWWLLGTAIRGEVPPITAADPVAYAAWVGCLVTAMNLLPFGQLDGGHVLSAIAPHRARPIGWATTAALGALGFAWWGWWAWALALHALGARHPMAVAGSTEAAPTLRAKVAAAGCAATFAACFLPAPW